MARTLMATREWNCTRPVVGARQSIDHVRRLSELGVASDAELAAGIRSGAFDDRIDDVVAAVRSSVVDKLSVANPTYMRPDDQSP